MKYRILKGSLIWLTTEKHPTMPRNWVKMCTEREVIYDKNDLVDWRDIGLGEKSDSIQKCFRLPSNARGFIYFAVSDYDIVGDIKV